MPKRLIEIVDMLIWKIKIELEGKLMVMEVVKRNHYILFDSPLDGLIEEGDPSETSFQLYITQLGVRQQISSQPSIKAVEQIGIPLLWQTLNFSDPLSEIDSGIIEKAVKTLIGMVYEDELGLSAN